MARVIGRVVGYYDVQEVEFGRVYRWCPGYVVIECDCGEWMTLARSTTTCGECGADHATLVSGELAAGQPKNGFSHPWHSRRSAGATGIPF